LGETVTKRRLQRRSRLVPHLLQTKSRGVKPSQQSRRRSSQGRDSQARRSIRLGRIAQGLKNFQYLSHQKKGALRLAVELQRKAKECKRQGVISEGGCAERQPSCVFPKGQLQVIVGADFACKASGRGTGNKREWPLS